MVPDLLLQRPQDRHRLGVLLVVRVERYQVEWLELVDHELFDPVQFRLVFRVCFEVPHGWHLPSRFFRRRSSDCYSQPRVETKTTNLASDGDQHTSRTQG